MYTINFPAIAPSAAHNFSVKTIEFKMAAVSVKRSGLCVVYIQKYGAMLLVGAWQREKQQNELVE